MTKSIQTVEPTRRPFSIKQLSLLGLAIILLGLGAYLYFWYSSTMNELAKAKEANAKAQAFDQVKSAIEKEYDRCQAFISQETGDFSSFAYCQRFIQWVNNQTSIR